MESNHPELVEQALSIFCDWVRATPLITTLIFVISLDILAGILVAIAKKTLNSTTSYRGMCKKVYMLILLGLGSALEQFANGIPLAKLIAMSFIVAEGFSILENAAALGIWIPAPLRDLLQKLRENEQKKTDQKLPTKITAEVPASEGTTTVRITTPKSKE